MARLSKLERSVAGKVVVVTGAGNGMGAATAALFADEGATVAAADIVEDRLLKVVAQVEEAGGRIQGWTLDVSDIDAIRKFVVEVVERFGRIDVLVNNAGVSVPAPIVDDDFVEKWNRTLAVNLSAHVHLIRACLPYLKAEGNGRIVNIASTEGLGATAGISPYTASKHGVVGLTRSLAVELGSQGVTVNCVCPGPIHTGMTEGIPEEAKQKFARRRVPLRRYGEPEEVAHATLNFALPSSSYMNGVIMPVDGGMMAQNT